MRRMVAALLGVRRYRRRWWAFGIGKQLLHSQGQGSQLLGLPGGGSGAGSGSGFSTAGASGKNVNNGESSNPPPTPPSVAGHPPPIRVSFTESAGRGVFATRRIGAGDLIHTANPVVSHPSLSTTHTVCYYCLKIIDPSESHSHASNHPTPTTTHHTFCTQQCQAQSQVLYEVERKADWSAYNEYCRNRGLKYPLLVRRLACMVISGVTSVDCLDILQPARLSPVMISEMEEEFNMLRSAFTRASVTDEQMAFLNSQWYISVLARIRINAFRVELIGGTYEDLLSSAAAYVQAEAAVGNAVYMLPSFYNHDCDPNTHIVWIDNASARIKALRDIQAGEELRISYIDASMGYDARQTLLREGFGFQCCCPRCLSGD